MRNTDAIFFSDYFNSLQLKRAHLCSGKWGFRLLHPGSNKKQTTPRSLSRLHSPRASLGGCRNPLATKVSQCSKSGHHTQTDRSRPSSRRPLWGPLEHNRQKCPRCRHRRFGGLSTRAECFTPYQSSCILRHAGYSSNCHWRIGP